jgi:CRISPR system Cascade subunit CasB
MPLDGPDLDHRLATVSQALSQLDTGALADLRRMTTEGVGRLPFWHLAKDAGFLDAVPIESWMRIVKIMAILTPKGNRTRGVALHNPKRRLGAVLCDGGDPSWHDPGRPFLSETRLARLLAQPSDRRGEALERIARSLANRIVPGSGINCADIARVLLFPDTDRAGQDLARSYYRRLDTATRSAPSEDDDA